MIHSNIDNMKRTITRAVLCLHYKGSKEMDKSSPMHLFPIGCSAKLTVSSKITLHGKTKLIYTSLIDIDMHEVPMLTPLI